MSYSTLGSLYSGRIVRVAASGGTTEYLTITLALAAAVSGDSVIVGSGVYTESVVVPAGVTLSGVGDGTRPVISGAAAAGIRVTLNQGSRIENFSISCPNDATSAVSFTGGGAAERVECVNCSFTGTGVSGRAISLLVMGILYAKDLEFTTGDMAVGGYVTGGQLTIDRSVWVSANATYTHW